VRTYIRYLAHRFSSFGSWQKTLERISKQLIHYAFAAGENSISETLVLSKVWIELARSSTHNFSGLNELLGSIGSAWLSTGVVTMDNRPTLDEIGRAADRALDQLRYEVVTI
jgi:hypothetical protein